MSAEPLKACPKCSRLKTFAEFYTVKGRRSGLSSWCKLCTSESAKARYRDDPEGHRAAASRWKKENPGRIKAKTQEGRVRWLEIARLRRERNPEAEAERRRRYYLKQRRDPSAILRRRAKDAVRSALRSGSMVRQSCSSCGREPFEINGVSQIQGHHPRGYSEEHALDVTWLCARCHRLAHGKES